MDCTYMGSESLQAAVTTVLHYIWKPWLKNYNCDCKKWCALRFTWVWSVVFFSLKYKPSWYEQRVNNNRTRRHASLVSVRPEWSSSKICLSSIIPSLHRYCMTFWRCYIAFLREKEKKVSSHLRVIHSVT